MDDRPDQDDRPYQARNAEQYSDADFLSAVEAGELVPTSGVAESVGCSIQTALRRLQQLEDRGEVESKQFAGPYVWRRR